MFKIYYVVVPDARLGRAGGCGAGGGGPKCLPIYHAVGSDARFPVRVAEEQGARGSHKV